MLKETELPFSHYYVYGAKIVNVSEGQWILDEIEKIRVELKSQQN